jgi:hypothetical protein
MRVTSGSGDASWGQKHNRTTDLVQPTLSIRLPRTGSARNCLAKRRSRRLEHPGGPRWQDLAKCPTHAPEIRPCGKHEKSEATSQRDIQRYPDISKIGSSPALRWTDLVPARRPTSPRSPAARILPMMRGFCSRAPYTRKRSNIMLEWPSN